MRLQAIGTRPPLTHPGSSLVVDRKQITLTRLNELRASLQEIPLSIALALRGNCSDTLVCSFSRYFRRSGALKSRRHAPLIASAAVC